MARLRVLLEVLAVYCGSKTLVCFILLWYRNSETKSLKRRYTTAMATLVFIGAIGFLILLDVAMGIFILHWLAWYFNYSLTWYHYILIAPVIAVLPDILDATYQEAKEGEINDAHHLFPHYPLPMLLIALFGGLFTGLPFWGLVTAVSWLAHYIHDCCEDGFGLKWFWPFNNNRYRFIRGRVGGGQYVFTPEEYKQLCDLHYGDLPVWLKRDYYQVTSYSGVEFTVSAALIYLVIFSFDADTAALYERGFFMTIFFFGKLWL